VVSPKLALTAGGRQVMSQSLPRMMVGDDGVIKMATTQAKEALALRGSPQVDGKLDDECWRRALPLTGFMPLGESDFAERQTVTRLCRDERCLYVAASCFGRPRSEIRAEATRRDEPMLVDDVVEVWLKPPGSEKLYRLKVNPNAAVHDAVCDASGEQKDWNAQLTVAALVRDDGWQFELAIPLADLGVGRLSDDAWRLNLMAARSIAPREVETWSYLSVWPPKSSEWGTLKLADHP
jgi:hypothetical protein